MFISINSTSEDENTSDLNIKPTFVLINKLDVDINVASLNVVGKGRQHWRDVSLMGQKVGKCSTSSLLYWQLVGGKASNEQLFDGFQHLSFSIDNSEWSIPILLDDSNNSNDCRRNVFLPLKSDNKQLGNVALVMTSHIREGQHYLVVNYEEQPQIMIHNALKVPILYGQQKGNF